MYRLTDFGVQRVEDGAHIPSDPNNRDWQAYLEWAREGNAPLPMAAPPQEELDRRTRRQELRANAVIQQLATATPAQIDTYIDNNVTNLAQARTVLKALAMAVSVLLKEGL